jgi:hypothetical protein
MKLNKYEILNLLEVEKIEPDTTNVYNIYFDKFLDKLLIDKNEKILIKKIYEKLYLNTEKQHLNKIAELLENKIEAFSDDFWELFFFRKHSYHSDYENRKWFEFKESYEDKKIVKKRVKVLKNLNITLKELENFLNKLTYKQDGYVDLWFSLKKKNKDNYLNENNKQMILKYGLLDTNETQKAVMLSYFNEIIELEKLYEKNYNSSFKKEIENELKKHKKFEFKNINLFEGNDYHQVIYRKNIIINENALIYELEKNKKIIDKIVEIIEKFLNSEIFKLKKDYYDGKYVYTIEGYSEEHLKKEKN